MTPVFFEATVLRSTLLTPGMMRMTFGGEPIRHFLGTGVPDEFVRLFFANPATGRMHLPLVTADGRWTYPDGGVDALRFGTYTIRHHRPDVGEIDIDIVIHDGGTASAWAQQAVPGTTITMNQPNGLYTLPEDAEWQLLAADATGLPAVARILEQTPEHISSRVFIEVAAADHEQPLPFHPLASVTWLHRSGNGVAPSRMADMVRSMPLPTTPGYIWAAGEQRVVRAIRKFVRQELTLKPERYQLVGYWTHNNEDWKERWNAVPQAVKDAIDASFSSGRDVETVRDEYYATLEKYGL